LSKPELKELRPAELLKADLETLLREPYGRRLAYWLIYDICKLEGDSLNLALKDGLCAALHQARADGIRAVGASVAAQMRMASPDGFLSAYNEGVKAIRSAHNTEPEKNID
jgi:hypothetical protein